MFDPASVTVPAPSTVRLPAPVIGALNNAVDVVDTVAASTRKVGIELVKGCVSDNVPDAASTGVTAASVPLKALLTARPISPDTGS